MGIILLLHGIGHAMGLLPLFGVKLSQTHSSHSRLLTGPLGKTATGIIGALFFCLSLIAFVCAGLSLLGWLIPGNLWPSLAIAAPVISLVGLFFFWNGFPFLFPNKIGVIAVDILTLAAVLIYKWAPSIV